MKKEYDYLIVGAGLFGATFAWCAKQSGKRCLVIDKRRHIGGNVYDREIEGINVHEYAVINWRHKRALASVTTPL